MKIAIVHDWLVTYGGAEKVLQSLIQIYPDAEIYTLVDFLDSKQKKEIVNNKQIHHSFIQNFPFAKKFFRHYLPFFPLAIESFNFDSYDLIISSSWAVAKGIKKSPHQLHICYCHTPIRYAWDMYDEYTKELNPLKKFFVKATLQYLRKWDIQSLSRVDYFIANSDFVKQRILKTYHKDAHVIHPPVDIKSFQSSLEKESFYLSVCRLVSYKKVQLIVETFNAMPEKKLVVIGDGEEFESIKAMAQSNIEVLGYQKQEDVIEYMQKAKAFVYAAIEDFGISPIEAISCGTPVIALKKGATAQTINQHNGIHFEEQTVASLSEAIERFEECSFDPLEVSRSAEVYSTERFIFELQAFIEEKLKEKR